MSDCNAKKWFVFILVSIAIVIGGITVSLIGRVLRRSLRSVKIGKHNGLGVLATGSASSNQNVEDYLWVQRLKFWAAAIISGRKISGKVIVFFACACTITSVSIYVFEATVFPLEIEYCEEKNTRLNLFWIDFACNCFFLAYFVLRFMAAEDKVLFWLEIYSLVDVFTIPSIFVTIYLHHFWSGLRFLRAIWLVKLPELFQYFSILTTEKRVRLCELFAIFFSTWIAGSGLVHLLENTGDPWILGTNTNRQTLTFFECLYFTIVTMSTVGYGDFSPQTVLGRVWICLFIMISFAMFASSIPEIAQLITSGSKFTHGFTKQRDHKHIVVCGDVSLASVTSLISDLGSRSPTGGNLSIVLIHPEEPQLPLQTLLNKHQTTLKYVKGSVMNKLDLSRASISDADACLILAKQHCEDPNEEDSANILRFIALKNFRTTLRIIVQILRSENKSDLTNLPMLDNGSHDNVICINELELGILAKSCIIPGFSTFITNLFSIHLAKDFSNYPMSNKDWLDMYRRGAEMEIYTERFSSSLTSMTFHDLVAFCYRVFSVLLIAVEVKRNGKSVLLLNPSSLDGRNEESTGYFIARSSFETRRVAVYCKLCHGSDSQTAFRTDNKKCRCLRSNHPSQPLIRESISTYSNHFRPSKELQKPPNRLLNWGFKDFEACHVKDPKNPLGYDNHILLCIVSNEDSPFLGLLSFIEPLRARNLKAKQIRTVVIAGNRTFLEREWQFLSCIPNILMVSLTKINMESLQILGLDRCHACILMSAKVPSNSSSAQEINFVDNEVVLATLHAKTLLKSLKIPNVSPKRPIYVISKINAEENVHLIDSDSENVTSLPVCLSQPFACGRVFVTSSLKSLSSLSYLNLDAFRILRMLISGSTSNLNEINPMVKSDLGTDHLKVSSLLKEKYAGCFHGNEYCLYIDVFFFLLKTHRVICLGLYRSTGSDSECIASTNNRVILTNPSPDLPVHKNDYLLILKTSSP